MAKSIFVTATGTDIGKTFVSALLVKKMRELGLNCGYFKPVLSGAIKADGTLIPGDCKYVVDVAQLNVEPLKCLSYCFEEAISPHLAAKRCGVDISISKILSDYVELSKYYQYMVIEGAGGITCPIIMNDDSVFLMSDLIKQMEQSVVVVADGGLGTINSVLTTVEYVEKRGINIEGVILNNFDKNNYMHVDNLQMIEKLTNYKVIGTVSHNAVDFDINKDLLLQIFK